MARGNSKAQSELVDRLKAKVGNRNLDKELTDIRRGEADAVLKRARGAEYEKSEGLAAVQPWNRVRVEELVKAASSGPLSSMKNSTLLESLTKPKSAEVTDEKSVEIAELALKITSLDKFIGGDNYKTQLSEGRRNDEGDTPDLQNDEGEGFSYDTDSVEETLPERFIEQDGKFYQVVQSVSVPVEIDEDNVLRSTATSAKDIEHSFTVREISLRPGEYVKNGRFIATYDGGWTGSRGPGVGRDEEKKSPEFKKARKEFENLETQVNQWNSIIKKNPSTNQNARLIFSEKLYKQGVRGAVGG